MPRLLPMLLPLLFLTACDRKPTPSLATPKQAAKTFFQACFDNDPATAKACVLPGAAQERLAAATTTMMSGIRQASDALHAKWGHTLKTPDGQPINPNQIDPAQLDTALEATSGDSATLTLPKSGRTIPLKRHAGQWRVDLLGFHNLRTSPLGDEAATLAATMLEATAKAGHAVAADIKADKYATPEAALKDLAKRMNDEIQAEVRKHQKQP